jgi:hypothetical protein
LFAVTLLEDFRVSNSNGSEEPKGAVFEYGCIALGFRVVSILKVTESNNAAFSPMWFAIFVIFHDNYTHGWDGSWYRIGFA